MQPSKTSQTSWQHHHNTFTPSLHLVPFGLVLVCVHRKVVKGNGLGSAYGCVVRVSCVVGAATQLLLSMADTVSLDTEAVECTSRAESVWHVRVYVVS